MLAAVGEPNAELDLHQAPGTRYQVTWVDIDEPDPDMDGHDEQRGDPAVGDQGRARGAAHFSRLEGATYADGRIYFTSTQGGEADTILGSNGTYEPVNDGYGRGRGQVWAYQPGPERLTCVYQSPGSSTLDLPDNVTTSANGTLVLCEDGTGDNFLRGLTTEGELFTSPATPTRARSARSSPAPRSAPTSRRCSSTSSRSNAATRSPSGVPGPTARSPDACAVQNSSCWPSSPGRYTREMPLHGT